MHLQKAEELIKLKLKKKLLSIRLQDMTDKNITLRNITNMSSNMKKTSHHNDFVKLVERLNAVRGKTITNWINSVSIMTVAT